MTKVITNEKSIEVLLDRGVEEAIEKESLKRKLLSGKQLRIKFGIDPTSPDLHLGHTVPLRKLRQFQDLGHQAILLIGDFTAKIGDPSGRNEARKMLTDEEVKSNFKHYQEQAGKVLDMEKVEVRFNTEWYDKKGYAFLFELTSKFTVARVMERDDFKKRLKDDVDISMVEILYPLLQGYDSVALDADVEIGGTDQKFNLLMGRKVQRKYKKLEQDIMTIPLLEGLDGVHKMSKSLGNYIGLTEDPVDMFGKLMSIPDSLIIKYFNLLTNIDREVIEKYKKEMRTSLTNPKDVKVILAADIVRQYYGPEEAQKSQEHFEKVFSKKEMPEEIETVEVKKGEDVIDVLVRSGMAESKSDARRKVEQGGVSIEGEVVKDFQTKLGEEYQDKIIKVGKRHFRKIKVL